MEEEGHESLGAPFIWGFIVEGKRFVIDMNLRTHSGKREGRKKRVSQGRYSNERNRVMPAFAFLVRSNEA